MTKKGKEHIARSAVTAKKRKNTWSYEGIKKGLEIRK